MLFGERRSASRPRGPARAASVCALAAFALVLAPGTASAAAVEQGRGTQDLRFAGTVTPSLMTIEWQVDRTILGDLIYTVRFIDRNDPPYPAPGSGCVREGEDAVSCMIAERPAVGVDLGAGNDVIDEIVEVHGTGSGPAPLFEISGGTGDDRLRGGPGADRINGGSGEDRLTGSDGSDRLIGGPGRDRLRGQNGSDSLRGRTGADWLDGGRDADKLGSGPGRDRLMSRDGVSRERVNCGRDEDVVKADPGDRLHSCEDVREWQPPSSSA